jgi:hypothetical protein
MLLEWLVSVVLGFLPSRLVRGEPYRVGRSTLTPVVRVHEIDALAGRLRIRSVEPVEVVEEAEGSTRSLVIRRAWVGPIVGAVVLGLPVLAYLIALSLVARR